MKAVTVGSATVDVIATVASEDIEQMTLHNSTTSFLLLEPGRKIDALSVVTHTGGGAVNAAVSLARQGFDVAALVKLGRDHNAEMLVDRLATEGISGDLVRYTDTEATAVSVMVASHDRNAAIFTHRGANGFLTEDDIPDDAFDGADLVFVTNLSNDSVHRFPTIVARAKAAGAFVASNPGIRQLTRQTDAFFDSLQHVDFFTCNFNEARSLVPALVNRTGWEREYAARCGDDTVLPTMEIEGFKLPLSEYFRRIHSLGPRFVSVTRGGEGSYLSEDCAVYHQDIVPAHVVGTAGAGDAFASTLAGALVRGIAPSKALRMAAHNASSVVSFVDTQTGLKSLAQLEKDAA